MKTRIASLLANRRPTAAAGRASAGAFDGSSTSAATGKGESYVRSIAKASSAGSNQRQATGLGRNRIAFVSLLALLTFYGISASSAHAAKGWGFKETFGAAEQPLFVDDRDLAVDESTGALLVYDNRGLNEVQRVTVSATAGQFKLEFEGDPTTNLAFNATAATVRDALRALPSIGSPNVNVSGGPGDAGGTKPYVITFTQALGQRNVDQLVCLGGTTPLSGGSGCTVETSTQGRGDTVSRWNPNGTPLDFPALGTNVIDGLGGGECPTVEADCDETEGIAGIAGNAADQIAIDNSVGTTTAGNIYIASRERARVDIFSAEGEFLGNLTGNGTGSFEEPHGLAVDDSGVVYVNDRQTPFPDVKIDVFQPAANPPVNGDALTPFGIASNIGEIAGGASSTDGFLFVAEGIGKYSDAFGGPPFELKYTFGGDNMLAVDQGTGNVFLRQGGGREGVGEWDASGVTNATKVAEVEDVGDTVRGIAPADSAELLYVARDGSESIDVWEAVTAPELEVGQPSFLSGAKATVTGTVKPEGQEIIECKFEYGKTTAYGSSAPCEPEAAEIPTDFGNHKVSGELTGLLANGAEYHYRLVVKTTGSFFSNDKILKTANTFATDAATGVSETEATLNGTAKLEGVSLTDCRFEYGKAFYSSSVPCNPAFGSIPNNDNDQPVSAVIEGLELSTKYRFRLAAENSLGQILTAERTFTTAGPPRVDEVPVDVDRTSATLQARINPAGSATTYHFEWGPSTTYANRIPADHNLFAGSGADPVTVKAELNGLTPDKSYSFRVVATNMFGTTVGSDQPFHTLSDTGLPNNRSYELVTPADKGSSGSVSELLGNSPQMFSVAAAEGTGILYPIQNGVPDSTSGGWTRWRGERTGVGWLNSQVSGPSLVRSLAGGEPSFVHYASPELDCAIVRSGSPLADSTTQLEVELGLENLYVWDGADGTYELITDRLPTNPDLAASRSGNFTHIDASDDCDHVFFRSRYKFIAGGSGLYEWHEGILRDAGRLPPNGSVGEEMEQIDSTGGPARAVLGGELTGQRPTTARWHAVSPSGSRAFFTAIADEGPSAGNQAIFMREERGASYEECEESLEFEKCVIEISASETATPTGAARFEAASPDGSKVFFRANYGIADESSEGPTNGACGPLESEENPTTPQIERKPCDLYVYDVGTEELTDISAAGGEANPQGAVVQGTVAVDQDGSHVYFAALGQLVPGEGRTYAQNTAGDGSANIYLHTEGELFYVTNLDHESGDLFEALMHWTRDWVADVAADGGRLLFVSSHDLDDYNMDGDKAAYLYSSDNSELECLSCPRDGHATLISVSASGGIFPVLGAPGLLARPLGEQAAFKGAQRASSMSTDGSRVIFHSPDVLALGGIAGKRNIYIWQEGQVSFLGIGTPTAGNGRGELLDVSADGDDVFIATAEQLVPEDKDFVSDVYDVRVDGGFPSEPEPAPCDPEGGGCQGDPSDRPDDTAPPTTRFHGEGDLEEPVARNRCAGRARRAQALSKRAKALRRRARRAPNRGVAGRNLNRARRAAKAARRNSEAAKRCRRRAPAANFNRGGVR